MHTRSWLTILGSCLLATWALTADGDDLWNGLTPWTGGGPHERFVQALSADGRGVWVGTEDHGCWFADAATHQWSPWQCPDGLGTESVQALVHDRSGRVWAGLATRGVAVLTHGRWQLIPGDAGPGGFHVTALAVSPLDGAVWLASENGLVRFSDPDAWQDLSAPVDADPPPRAARSLAFASDGHLFVGTPAHGVWSAGPSDQYRHWSPSRASDPVPREAHGPGLPSDLINAVLVSGDGTLWAATDLGLAWSHDRGLAWEHLCGRDWPALAHQPVPSGAALLSEDYTTCLHDAGHGQLWIGHRQTPVEVLTIATGTLAALTCSGDSTYARAFALGTEHQGLVATYGAGLAAAQNADQDTGTGPANGAPEPPISVPVAAEIAPTEAAAPTSAQLRDALDRVHSALKQERTTVVPTVLPLADDWRTSGDWLGRYGRYWITLAAIFDRPDDYRWGAGDETIDYRVMVGANHRGRESNRYWINWLSTDNPKVLEMPPIFLHSQVALGNNDWRNHRREAEWNDMGHAHPVSDIGPSLVVNLRLPATTVVVSLYDYNKDGHDGSNRWRDYHIALRRMPDGLQLHVPEGVPPWPVLAEARMVDFWNGCYQRYLVQGPLALSIIVERNHSFNTMLSAVAIDALDEYPRPYDAAGAPADAPVRLPDAVADTADDAAVAAGLTTALEHALVANPVWWVGHARPCYAALRRWYALDHHHASRAALLGLATCCYRLEDFPAWEDALHQAGERTVREIEQALRWDGTTDANGHERPALLTYLSGQQHAVPDLFGNRRPAAPPAAKPATGASDF